MATGYGVDIWCGDSLVTGRYARGKMNAVLAMYRRLITPRGTLRGIGGDEVAANEDELAYGLDLSALCGEVGPETAVLIVPGQIKAELLKDDRVADVFVSATYYYNDDGTAVVLFAVSGLLQNDGDDFQFTVKVEGVTTSLLLGGAAS